MTIEPQNRWVARSGEVLYASADFVTVTPDDIVELKHRAAASPRGRCRLCLHQDPAASLHDMVIALARGVYDRPHRHLAKAETLIALEGEAICLRYTQDGRPMNCERFSAVGGTAGARILRMPVGEFHGLLVTSEWLVFCESTVGPFDPAASEAAPWSPKPDDKSAVECYLAELNDWVATHA